MLILKVFDDSALTDISESVRLAEILPNTIFWKPTLLPSSGAMIILG
jgi:hypothetical protein